MYIALEGENASGLKKSHVQFFKTGVSLSTANNSWDY